MDECTSIYRDDGFFSFFTWCNSILWMFDEVLKQNRGDNERNVEEKNPKTIDSNTMT